MKSEPKDKCEIWAVDQDRVEATRQSLPPDEVFTLLAENFSALSDSNRAKILHCLLEQELCVCDIASIAGISESATSQHLRILRTLRMVTQRKQGRMMYYSLNDEHVKTLFKISLEHARHA